MKWNPIETAPDGQLLLFCSMVADSLASSFYVDWMVNGRLCSGVSREPPTHWMSLPDRPRNWRKRKAKADLRPRDDQS